MCSSQENIKIEHKPINHEHNMVNIDIIKNACEVIEVYKCSFPLCNYSYKTFTHNTFNCDMRVIKFSTRMTCYECKKCGRINNDVS